MSMQQIQKIMYLEWVLGQLNKQQDGHTKVFYWKVESALRKIKKKINGRPKVSFFKKKDNLRVFALWYMIKDWPQDKRSKITNRELILLAQEVSYSKNTKELFDDSMSSNIEQSVSRGRTALKIDADWNSEVCEKLYESISQTT